MPSLSRVDARFEIDFEILVGGSGLFRGIITEPNQGDVPAYQFNHPRRLLKVAHTLPLAPRMVVRDIAGTIFILGNHGAAQSRDQILFRNFRMFVATGQFTWKTRGKAIDPVTLLERDTGLIDQPAIYGAFEPSPEQFDRQMRTNFEVGRFITHALVERDDVVDGRKVNRVDEQLGLSLVTLG